MKKIFFKPGAVLSAIALLLIIGSTDSGLAGKGGGKPPKDGPPPNPVLVFRTGSDVVVADADGGNKTVVYNLDIELNSASWCSPDGTDIVFVDEINGTTGVYRLQVIEVDAMGNRTVQVGDPILVAPTNDIGLTRPACSPMPIGPDNKIKVVYRDRVIEEDGSLSEYDNLYLTNLDGSSAPILLLDGSQRGGLAQFNPSWSPSGDRIVFGSSRWTGDFPDVEVVRLDWDANNGDVLPDCCQSLVQGVNGSPLLERNNFLKPSWSNNGAQIAVDARNSAAYATEIWIIPVNDPAKADQVVYVQNNDVIRADVGWSPDDSQLIYLRNPRRGMCSEGDGRNVKGTALAVSNVGGASEPIEKDGLSCDEVAVIRDGRLPDWWRGLAE